MERRAWLRFTVADDGGQALFTHISAFARDRKLPVVGERLSFEVEPDRDGKKRAVRVRRPGAHHAASAPALRQNVPRLRKTTEQTGIVGKLISLALIGALAWYGYGHYAARAAKFDSAMPVLPAFVPSAKLLVPADFKCDGNGNGDGVPCEQQWCM